MAQLGSFFRRLFTPNAVNNPCSSSSSSSVKSDTRKSICIISPLSAASLTTSQLNAAKTRSCSASLQSSPHADIRQRIRSTDNKNETCDSDLLSSDTNKTAMRRLSTPLTIHNLDRCSSNDLSMNLNQSTDEALLSSLQHLSVSSSTTINANPNNSIDNLSVHSGRSTSLLLRPNVRSASFNLSPSPNSLSSHSINNILPLAGR